MKQILAILTEIRPEGGFEESNNYVSDGLLDSTDVVALVAALDGKYNISIEGTDILPEHFETAVTISKLLEKYGIGA